MKGLSPSAVKRGRFLELAWLQKWFKRKASPESSASNFHPFHLDYPNGISAKSCRNGVRGQFSLGHPANFRNGSFHLRAGTLLGPGKCKTRTTSPVNPGDLKDKRM